VPKADVAAIEKVRQQIIAGKIAGIPTSVS
jgi:hypothetical protein